MKVINKINTKHAKWASIKPDGTVTIFYGKSDRDSGQYLIWEVETDLFIPIDVLTDDNGVEYTFDTINLLEVNLLKYTEQLTVWPNTSSTLSREVGITRNVIVVRLSCGESVRFTEVLHNGESIMSDATQAIGLRKVD